MTYITLSNGVKMPSLGYGVYQVDATESERCVLDEIDAGYRSIDTAQAYQNEEGMGCAIAKCGIQRDELFITTKIWISNSNDEKAKVSIKQSCENLKSDYVDLLLIHQPFNDYYGAYRAMEEVYKDGLARAIGVSNFYPDRLIDLCKFTHIPPMINQVETHVLFQEKELHKIMSKYNVYHQSWAPFAEGRKDFFNNKVLLDLASKYKKSVAQIALRFLLQSDVVVIPKSTHKDRMLENIDVFNFEILAKDMKKIEALDEGSSAFFSHYDAETVEFLTNWKL